MKTIKSLEKKVNIFRNEIDKLTVERSVLKNKRDSDSTDMRKEIDSKVSVLKSEISSLNREIYRLEKLRKKVIVGSLLSVSVLLFVSGIVLTIVYNYNVGLEIFTVTHDIKSTFEGDTSLISVDLYNYFFKLKMFGSVNVVVGLLMGVVTTFVGLLWD